MWSLCAWLAWHSPGELSEQIPDDDSICKTTLADSGQIDQPHNREAKQCFSILAVAGRGKTEMKYLRKYKQPQKYNHPAWIKRWRNDVRKRPWLQDIIFEAYHLHPDVESTIDGLNCFNVWVYEADEELMWERSRSLYLRRKGNQVGASSTTELFAVTKNGLFRAPTQQFCGDLMRVDTTVREFLLELPVLHNVEVESVQCVVIMRGFYHADGSPDQLALVIYNKPQGSDFKALLEGNNFADFARLTTTPEAFAVGRRAILASTGKRLPKTVAACLLEDSYWFPARAPLAQISARFNSLVAPLLPFYPERQRPQRLAKTHRRVSLVGSNEWYDTRSGPDRYTVEDNYSNPLTFSMKFDRMVNGRRRWGSLTFRSIALGSSTFAIVKINCTVADATWVVEKLIQDLGAREMPGTGGLARPSGSQ